MTTETDCTLTDEERWMLRDMALWSQSGALFAAVERIIASRERAALNRGWGLGAKHMREALRTPPGQPGGTA